jgi:putative serine protease PepD
MTEQHPGTGPHDDSEDTAPINAQEPSPGHGVPETPGSTGESTTEPATEHTHRYAPYSPFWGRSGAAATPGDRPGERPGGTTGEVPPGALGPQTAGAPSEPRKHGRGSGELTAGVLVAALVVGGLGGVAGAAGFVALDYLHGGGATTAASSPSGRTTSTVVKTPSQPASGSVEQVANQVLPSVVQINVQGQQGGGSGSGIIISSDGEILTNNHVVSLAAGGGSITVNFNDGSAARAQVIGTDPATDVAVIKAQGVSGLQPATLGSSTNLQVGQEVVAIGSPFGLESTVTSGIVSALNRPVSVGQVAGPSSPDTTYPAIQTDAAINPGNSGGPLVNMDGQVVGINSSIRTTGSSLGGEPGSIGLGFAIPIDEVLPIAHQILQGQTPTHARLGVTVTDAKRDNGLLTGAGVVSITPGSAAAQAGLQKGDVITRLDGQVITGAESLVAMVRGHRPGDTVTMTVAHGSNTQQVKVTLGSDHGSLSS